MMLRGALITAGSQAPLCHYGSFVIYNWLPPLACLIHSMMSQSIVCASPNHLHHGNEL